MNTRLVQQLDFIYEIDKVKNIIRKTKLFSDDRRENDAEHSWHICMMAMVLEEYANEKIDVNRVIKMLLVHDLVEIYTGDVIVYDAQTKEHIKKETEAAHQIFGMLPEDQYHVFLGLWCEFEDRETNESKFARVLDRLEPIMQNYKRNAETWAKYGIDSDTVLGLNKVVISGSKPLWELVESMVKECIDKGYIR